MSRSKWQDGDAEITALGRDDIAHAKLYSPEAFQELLAREAMNKVTRFVQVRRKRSA